MHTPKHNKLRQNKQARQFQILITHSNANDPTTQLITTHKISYLNSFGTHSFCTTLWHSFTLSTATNSRHDRFSKFYWDIQQVIICVIILFLNSHMPDFHLHTQQITISYNCMYQTHNMVLTTVYHSQNYHILTVICCWYIIVMQPKQSSQHKTTSFEQHMLCSLLNPLVCWCSTVSSCSYFTEQSNSGNHDNKV